MPNSIVKSFAKKTGRSIKDVEGLWTKAINLAKKQGVRKDSNTFFAYVVGILKKMLKLENKDLLTTSGEELFEIYTDGTPHRLRQTPIHSTSKIFKRDSFLKSRDDRDQKKKRKKTNKRPPLNHVPGVTPRSNRT